MFYGKESDTIASAAYSLFDRCPTLTACCVGELVDGHFTNKTAFYKPDLNAIEYMKAIMQQGKSS